MNLPEWIEVILLGIIEGITEFLPISSTGHLLLADQWLTHPQSDLFIIVIQSGAVLAVMLIYRERLRQLLWRWREPASRDYLSRLGVAFFITAVGGLMIDKLNLELPETATPIAIALLVGGILFLVIERWLRGRSGTDQVSWLVAVAVGASQIVAAVFPGTSRSGAAILISLLLGLRRPAAVEFSFLLGIPTLLAAGAYKLFQHHREPGGEDLDWGMLTLGTVVSGVVGFAAVKWLLRYIQTHTFVIFGWYRIALGLIILVLLLR